MSIIKKVNSLVIINDKLRIGITYLFSKLLNEVYTGPFSFLKLIKKEEKFLIKNNEILVKTLMCGICGSDKKIISFDYSLESTAFPETKRQNLKETYLGHEVVGQVIKIGQKVKKIKKNDIVIIDSINRKNHNLKNNKYGGWSNFFVRNENQLFKVDKKLKKSEAIFIEPLACSLNAVIEADIKDQRKKVLIIGTGIIGIGVYIFLRYFFKKIDITFLSNSKIPSKILSDDNNIKKINSENIVNETARILNTDIKKFLNNKITSKGFDYIFECSGDESLLNEIVKICNFNSKIILNGMIMKKSKFDLSPLWLRNIKIISTNGYKSYYKYKDIFNTFEFIQKLVILKKINLDVIKIKKIDFQKWKSALKKRDNDVIKNVLQF